jgi:hypothetical protein
MSLVSDAVTTVAPTIVTADRAVNSAGANALYERGSTFAQALSKVEPAPAVQDKLDQSGKLATPDAMTSLQTLLQATQPASASSQPTGSMAQLQQSLQAGGERLRDATRVGLDLKF